MLTSSHLPALYVSALCLLNSILIVMHSVAVFSVYLGCVMRQQSLVSQAGLETPIR